MQPLVATLWTMLLRRTDMLLRPLGEGYVVALAQEYD
jgi:hypothetical protein